MAEKLRMEDCMTPKGEKKEKSKEAVSAAPADLKTKAREAAKRQLCGLMDEKWDDIWACMKASFEVYNEDVAGEDNPKSFVYGISGKVDIETSQGDFNVSAALAYAVRHKASSMPVKVSDQMDMFDPK
jgi:hypothetical protein